MSSSAPCAQPTATLATASAISAGIGMRTIGASRDGRVGHRVERSLRGHDRRVDVEVVAAGPAEAGHRPRVLDHDLVGGEDGGAKARDAVDDRLDAVAVDPVGVLAAAGEAPPAGRAVPAVGGGDRARRVEHAGRDDVGRDRRTARRRWRAAARRGRTTSPIRSSRSSPPTRRPGRAPRTRAWRRAGPRRRRRASRAAPRGTARAAISSSSRSRGTRRPASISAARAAMDGARRRAASSTPVGVAMPVSAVVNVSSALGRSAPTPTSVTGERELALRSNSPTSALGRVGNSTQTVAQTSSCS